MVPLVDAAFLMLEMFRVVGCYSGPIVRDLDVQIFYKQFYFRSIVSYRNPGENTVYVNGLLVWNECDMAETLAFHSTGVMQDRYESSGLDRERYRQEVADCCLGYQQERTDLREDL